MEKLLARFLTNGSLLSRPACEQKSPTWQEQYEL